MDVNKLKPMMNQRGFYEVLTTDGSKVPTELSDQIWTSEREANFAIVAYTEKNKAKKEA